MKHNQVDQNVHFHDHDIENYRQNPLQFQKAKTDGEVKATCLANSNNRR